MSSRLGQYLFTYLFIATVALLAVPCVASVWYEGNPAIDARAYLEVVNSNRRQTLYQSYGAYNYVVPVKLNPADTINLYIGKNSLPTTVMPPSEPEDWDTYHYFSTTTPVEDGCVYYYWWLYRASASPYSYSFGEWVAQGSSPVAGIHDAGITKTGFQFAPADTDESWVVEWHADDYGYHNYSFWGTANETNISGHFIIEFDNTNPQIISVNSMNADGVYEVGATVDIQVQFDEVIYVDGSPQLLLETGTTDQYALYSGGDGTDTLTFTYTVQAGDISDDLDCQSASALVLNTATIWDEAGNLADLTVPVGTNANSLVSLRNLKINALPIPGIISAPSYTESSYITVDYSGASDEGSGLKQVELWQKKETDGLWQACPGAVVSSSTSGSFNIALDDGEGSYYFCLVAEDSAGNRSLEPTAGDIDTASTEFVLITAFHCTADTIHAEWTAEINPVTNDVDDYEYRIVCVDPQGVETVLAGPTIDTSDSGVVTLTGQTIVADNTYIIYVRRQDHYGVWSAESSAKATYGRTVYVKAGSTGDGSSWTNAFGSITDAMPRVISGTQVLVAAGTYTGSITIPAGTQFYGGFDGIGSQAKPVANETTINADETFTVKIDRNAGNDTVIDGFTITGASSQGGIWCENNASPVISRNKITNNNSLLNGGGIHVSSGSPSIENNLIIGNFSFEAGCGIYLESGYAVVENNTVCDNDSFSYAGAIEIGWGADPLVANNFIGYNFGSYQVSSFGGGSFHNNNVVGGYGIITDPTGTNGNISVDPLFVDRANGNYDLLPTSPNIDAGNTNWMSYTDRYGNSRCQDGDGDGLQKPDIGASEFVPLTVTINQAEGQLDPANTSPVHFTVTFSEPVIGFNETCVSIETGILDVTTAVTGSGAEYDVQVELPASSAGTIIATVPAGVVQNSVGAWNCASTYSDPDGSLYDNSVLYDDLDPVVSTFTAPTYSSSPIELTFQASDTGGSGILGLEFYYIQDPDDPEQDVYLGYVLESGGVVAVPIDVEGVAYYGAYAVDNAGNCSEWVYCGTHVDLTAPTAPTNVVMDHVIPTSKVIHGSWNESTDNYTGVKDYWVEFYYTDATGEHSIISGTVTGTQASYTMSSFPSVGNGRTYSLRVKARDNALNESSLASSAGVTCKKARVGYFYYLGANVFYVPGEYDGMRSYIRRRMNSVATSNADIMQYDQFAVFPSDINQYDVLMISCPSPDVALTTYQMNQISVWANKWHRRLVLIGDCPGYGDPAGYYNQRLNNIAQSVSANIPPFNTSSDPIPKPYNIGTCTYFQYIRPWLMTDVYELNYASPGYFNYDEISYNDWIAAAHTAYQWIIERDLNDGGVALCIHDMNVFDVTHINISHANFVRNFCTKFE